MERESEGEWGIDDIVKGSSMTYNGRGDGGRSGLGYGLGQGNKLE